jgi:hypothetical protein
LLSMERSSETLPYCADRVEQTRVLRIIAIVVIRKVVFMAMKKFAWVCHCLKDKIKNQ